jgi:hypothetical protein
MCKVDDHQAFPYVYNASVKPTYTNRKVKYIRYFNRKIGKVPKAFKRRQTILKRSIGIINTAIELISSLASVYNWCLISVYN